MQDKCQPLNRYWFAGFGALIANGAAISAHTASTKPKGHALEKALGCQCATCIRLGEFLRLLRQPQSVADPRFGEQILWIVRLGFDLLAQPIDEYAQVLFFVAGG